MNTNLEQQTKINTGAEPGAFKPPFVQAGAALPAVPANGINGATADDIGIASYKPAAGSPPAAAPKILDGWEGNSFYINGKRYVVAISPEISKNGLHELRTYCYTGDKQVVPSEEITTTLLQPVKVSVTGRSANPNIVTVNSGKKCLVCGRLITWGNSRVKYCSDPCQKKAHLMKKEAVKS